MLRASQRRQSTPGNVRLCVDQPSTENNKENQKLAVNISKRCASVSVPDLLYRIRERDNRRVSFSSVPPVGLPYLSTFLTYRMWCCTIQTTRWRIPKEEWAVRLPDRTPRESRSKQTRMRLLPSDLGPFFRFPKVLYLRPQHATPTVQNLHLVLLTQPRNTWRWRVFVVLFRATQCSWE